MRPRIGRRAPSNQTSPFGGLARGRSRGASRLHKLGGDLENTRSAKSATAPTAWVINLGLFYVSCWTSAAYARCLDADDAWEMTKSWASTLRDSNPQSSDPATARLDRKIDSSPLAGSEFIPFIGGWCAGALIEL